MRNRLSILFQKQYLFFGSTVRIGRTHAIPDELAMISPFFVFTA